MTKRCNPKPKISDKETLSLADRIVCAECVAFMRGLPDNFLDLTVTSPPYDNLRDYKGFMLDCERIAEELFRITKEGGVAVWVVGDAIKNGNKTLTSFRQALLFQEAGFNMHDVMIYKKKNTPFMRSNAYTNCFEFMFVLSKGSPKTFNPIKEPTARSGFEMLVANKKADGVNNKVLKELKREKTKNNIWEYAVGLGGSTNDKEAFKHPAIFPEKLAEDHILSWTNRGDLVFDPFMGSGTTAKMAKKLGRRYLGCDISQEYVAIAQKRVEETKEDVSLFQQT
ncbi:MAG: site-specific DNA-methyltransferase [Helicobacteraceae bacterium]|jgi:site-specific DNA-methyltransferase (adenine-specific)|nr:site-specific DNA-methyltransferase [Helicobacteraceae bacterium]